MGDNRCSRRCGVVALWLVMARLWLVMARCGVMKSGYEV